MTGLALVMVGGRLVWYRFEDKDCREPEGTRCAWAAGLAAGVLLMDGAGGGTEGKMSDGGGRALTGVVMGGVAFVLLAADAAAQDYFPGFEVAAQADVVHVTSDISARPDDDTCVLDVGVLAAEAESALRRHGYNAVVLGPPVVVDVTLDVSALVLPVLGTDSCAVATRVQLVVGGDGVLLAAEYFNLLTWTTTGLLERVSMSVRRDVDAIGGEMRRATDGGP